MNKFITILILTVCHVLQAITTTVIVPCIPENVHLLPDLVESYNNQSKLPDEMIITLSDLCKMDIGYIYEIEECKDLAKFKILFLVSQKNLSIAEHRNTACKYSTGKLLIFNNPDDLPHKQRIEIIRSFFELPNVDFLIHKWKGKDDINDFNKNYRIGHIPYYKIKRSEYQGLAEVIYDYGNIAFRKPVYEKIKWQQSPKKDDLRFLQDVGKYGFETILIDANLIKKKKK